VWGSTANDALGFIDGKACSKKKVQLVPKRFASSPTSHRNSNPNLVNGGSAIRVVAGNGFSTILTDKWEAYSWGNGVGAVDGKNGRGRNRGVLAKTAESSAIRKVQAGNVTRIAHGTGHTCVVTLNGEIYGWGNNAHGNLGVDGRQSNSSNAHGRQRALASLGGNDARRRFVAKPRRIDVGDNSSKSIDVACGEKHTCILHQNGTILTMGANDAGQLGIGSNDRHREKHKGFHIIQSARRGPKMLSCIPFREIACGNNHCAAISLQDGSLFTWGWGVHGRLGHGNETLHTHPTYVEALSEFVPFATVACGSAHTLVATEDGGDVYGFGWNAHGQVIGSNKDHDENYTSTDDCLLPVLCLKQKGVIKLSCSGFNSAAITLTGNLYLWGMNEDGQCGAGHELPIASPSRVNFQNTGSEIYVVSVACGHSHTVCILSNYLPLEATDLIANLEKYPSSVQVIVRFARYTLLRARLSRLLHDKQSSGANDMPVIQIIEDSAPKDSPEIELQLDESSSLSSHSSWSDGHYDLNTESQPKNDELYQRLIEMQNMSDEDHRSSAHMSHLRALRQRAIQAEKLVMEKKRAELERTNMRAEDVLSRKLRAHTRRQEETKRSTKRKNQGNTARDTRTNDHIQKAANRLRLARERKEQHANAKKILPKVQRQPKQKKQHANKKCIALHDIANNEQISEAEQARLSRRRKLVRRRESRLKIQKAAEKESALIRERNVKTKQEMDQLIQRQTRVKLEEERERTERARKLKLLKRSAELKRWEDELALVGLTQQKDDENKENENKFHDLKHWTKSLSGVT